MRRALEDGGIDAGDVQYVNAHGTSTPLNDPNEIRGHPDGVRRARRRAST